MKERWEYKKIKDIGSVVAGTTPNTNVAEYWDGSLCWISPAELDGNHYLYDSRKKITESAVKAKNLKLLPEGTVILSSRAPIGKVVINKVPTYCNQGFKCVVCGKEIYNEFLYWWFWGKTEYLNSLGIGATFKEISKKVVEDILIPVPPLSEQQSIVDYLDSAFAKIDAMKGNAEKALGEAKALFQASLKEMLEPKEGWEEKILQDICSDIVDCPHTTPQKVGFPTQYPCIRTSELKGGSIDWSTMQYLDEDEYKKRVSRLVPKPNDLVYGREGTYGDAVLLPDGYSFSLGQRTMLLRPNEIYIIPRFLLYSMISPHVYQQAKAKNSGCGVGHVNVKDIKVFRIGLPTIDIQQSIVDTLDSLKSKVDRLKANYDKISQECDALKQAILRQVFE